MQKCPSDSHESLCSFIARVEKPCRMYTGLLECNSWICFAFMQMIPYQEFQCDRCDYIAWLLSQDSFSIERTMLNTIHPSWNLSQKSLFNILVAIPTALIAQTRRCKNKDYNFSETSRGNQHFIDVIHMKYLIFLFKTTMCACIKWESGAMCFGCLEIGKSPILFHPLHFTSP